MTLKQVDLTVSDVFIYLNYVSLTFKSVYGHGAYSGCVIVVSELDALGDELLLDDDSSYLDEASAAPSIPEGIPSDSKTNKVPVHRAHCNSGSCVTSRCSGVISRKATT